MNKKKILIVDDEINFTKVVKLNLEFSGKFEVKVLTKAIDIISCLHSFKPDLILLDLIMPGIGGIEVCDLLNADPLGQGVPVVILSALDKTADKANAFKKGVVDYLVKTIDENELILRIEKALQLKYEI